MQHAYTVSCTFLVEKVNQSILIWIKPQQDTSSKSPECECASLQCRSWYNPLLLHPKMITEHTSPNSHCGITVKDRINSSACIKPAQSQTAQPSFSITAITLEKGIAQCHSGKNTLTILLCRRNYEWMIIASRHLLSLVDFAPHPLPEQVLDSWRRTRVALLLPQVFENELFSVGCSLLWMT